MHAPSQPLTPEAAPSGGVPENLRRYAELGGFTLTPETHAWYAAAGTVISSEDARAASTVLAELRGRDLPAVRDAATRLASGTGLRAPGTVASTGRALALFLRVRDTLRTLKPEAYDEADLHELVAATASGSWRKERGVQLPWPRRRSLRGRARALALGRWPRLGSLHSALAAAAEARTEWADLVPGGTGPVLPSDSAFLDDAARAVESSTAGLAALGELLRPETPLGSLDFDDLSAILDRLASDEGTLHRLPALHALREDLEQRGQADLLAELTARGADVAAAEAAAEAISDSGTATTEPQPESVPGPRSEPPAPSAEPKPGAESGPRPGSESKPGSDAEPVAGPEAEAAREAEPVPGRSGAEPEAEPEPVASDGRTAPDAEPEPAPDAEPEAAPDAEPEAGPEPERHAEPGAEAGPEPEPHAEPAPKAASAARAGVPRAGDAPSRAGDSSRAGNASRGTKPARRRGRKPSTTPGRPVTAYSPRELVAIVRWIDGDSVERTDDELLRAAMKELGFARLGPRIKEALGAAIAEVRD
jgi:hypothetical protein